MQLVECVPNVSEGRNQSVIDALAQELSSSVGVELLHIDIGRDVHRTVYTCVGEPETLIDAIFRFVAKAVEQIDMRRHRGVHPRLGAVDVIPFIPLKNVTMETCVDLAKRLGKRLASELHLPVYLYAEATSAQNRKRLPVIRRGEFEGLAEKMRLPEWKPDYGPKSPHPTAGAVVCGARSFLIAYNIHLDTANLDIARMIAARIRESGDGRHPGRFRGLQAMGWMIPDEQRVQVSMNILDLSAAPLFEVYRTCCELAEQYGIGVLGSEIIGMVQKRALLGIASTTDETTLITEAIQYLKLTAFDPTLKILENRITLEKIDHLEEQENSPFSISKANFPLR